MNYYKVDVIESERGWGQKVDETRYFRTREEAINFQSQQNAQNNLHSAPDIYWRAEDPRSIDIPADLIKLILEDNKPKRTRKPQAGRLVGS